MSFSEMEKRAEQSRVLLGHVYLPVSHPSGGAVEEVVGFTGWNSVAELGLETGVRC